MVLLSIRPVIDSQSDLLLLLIVSSAGDLL